MATNQAFSTSRAPITEAIVEPKLRRKGKPTKAQSGTELEEVRRHRMQEEGREAAGIELLEKEEKIQKGQT